MKKEKLKPESVYHVYNRAHGKEKLFLIDQHYYEFLNKFALYIHPIIDTLAYCLMPNHFHLLVKVKKEEDIIQYMIEIGHLPKNGWENRLLESPELLESLISLQFRKLFSSYTQWFNHKLERKGGLFMLNYKRILVEDPTYFTKLVGYIHTNPIKHEYVEDLNDWTFSSYHAYTSSYKTRVKPIKSVRRLFDENFE
jgi:putative transposase